MCQALLDIFRSATSFDSETSLLRFVGPILEFKDLKPKWFPKVKL